MDINVGEIIGALGTISAITFALISAHRANKRDTEDKATSIAVLNSDIGYVKSGIDDIKQKQTNIDDSLYELNTRVSKTEDSAKSAHHRLDMHEARLVNLEHEQEPKE